MILFWSTIGGVAGVEELAAEDGRSSRSTSGEDAYLACARERDEAVRTRDAALVERDVALVKLALLERRLAALSAGSGLSLASAGGSSELLAQLREASAARDRFARERDSRAIVLQRALVIRMQSLRPPLRSLSKSSWK
jgi:hypothetical protein